MDLLLLPVDISRENHRFRQKVFKRAGQPVNPRRTRAAVSVCVSRNPFSSTFPERFPGPSCQTLTAEAVLLGLHDLRDSTTCWDSTTSSASAPQPQVHDAGPPGQPGSHTPAATPLNPTRAQLPFSGFWEEKQALPLPWRSRAHSHWGPQDQAVSLLPTAGHPFGSPLTIGLC